MLGVIVCALLVGVPDSRPLVAHEALVVSHADDEVAVSLPRLRIEDKRLAGMLAGGMAASPTLRALVKRIESSDLIVYVQSDLTLGEQLVGRMRFLARAGGYRYLGILVRPIGSRTHQIAVIGHELRHAVEVADTPGIIDLRSFEREYARMGHVIEWRPGRVAFETDAAVQTSERIVSELLAND